MITINEAPHVAEQANANKERDLEDRELALWGLE
jgi:hypothetical protein